MTSEGSFVQPATPRFVGHYDHWSMLMENFLCSKEYWHVVETGISAAADNVDLSDEQRKEVAEQRLKDLRAKNYLFQAIDRSILETILDKETSKGIWDSMKKKFQGNARVKRAQLQALRKDFETLHMKEGETVSNYFARTLTITNKMRFHGEKMSDVTVIEKILRSMTSKFNYVVCSIEESKDLDAMSIDKLQSSLLVHTQRMQGYIVEEQALQITHDNNFGKPSHGRSSFRGRGRGHERQGIDKSLVECFYCHDLGHFQYECPRKGRRNESQVNFTEATNDEPLLLMAYTEIEETEKLCSEDKKLCSEASDIHEDDDHTMEMFFMAAPEFIEERLDKELCSYCEGPEIPADAEDDHMMMDELCSYCEGPEIPADAEDDHMMEMIDNHTMEMLLMAHVEKALDETTWFLDSGCSNHMCGHKEFFSEIDESFCKSVKLGNNSSISVVGKGKIHLQINQISQILTEVFFIPELKNNLLSIGQLQEKGLGILFRNNTCKVYHPERGLIF